MPNSIRQIAFFVCLLIIVFRFFDAFFAVSKSGVSCCFSNRGNTDGLTKRLSDLSLKGGFGGCLVTLIQRSDVDSLIDHLQEKYTGNTKLDFYIPSAPGVAAKHFPINPNNN